MFFRLFLSVDKVHAGICSSVEPASLGLVFQFLDFKPIVVGSNKLNVVDDRVEIDVFKGKSCIFEAKSPSLELQLEAMPKPLSVLLVSGLVSSPSSVQLIGSSCVNIKYAAGSHSEKIGKFNSSPTNHIHP